MKREPCWTASLAVGSLEFVEKVKPLILSRRETEIVVTADNARVWQAAVIAYGHETDLKNASKAIKRDAFLRIYFQCSELFGRQSAPSEGGRMPYALPYSDLANCFPRAENVFPPTTGTQPTIFCASRICPVKTSPTKLTVSALIGRFHAVEANPER